MKKILLLWCLFLSMSFAKDYKVIILPSEEFYPNLNTQTCNTNCLFEFLESGLYLSFLSEFIEQGNEFLTNAYAKLLNSVTDFDANLQKITSVKLAIILPEKTLKSYSSTIVNSSIAYLLRQRAEIKVKVFLIGTEEANIIKETLQKIEVQNYEYVIAGFTLKGVNELANYNGKLKIFIPSIHKNNTTITNANIYFGSIDYDAQISKLLSKTNGNLAIFSDDSALSSHLNSRILALQTARIYHIADEKFDFAKLLYSQDSLNDTSIFFNTPLIKTALVSSQLRVYNLEPFVLLSTQINYNPTFLSLTQQGDRKNFIIANSINNSDDDLSYLNTIFQQNINYNWIAYATSIGVDYFYTEFLNKKAKSIFEEIFENSQILYKVRLMKGTKASFEELNE